MSTPENWNSFDTAPRDGTKIIVKTPYGIEPGHKRWRIGTPIVHIEGEPKDIGGFWAGYDAQDNFLGMFVADFSKCGWLPFETVFTA